MADTSVSNFASLGEQFCWQARNFAFIYCKECVDTEHLLLAAAEVTPIELHGYRELTTRSIAKALEALGVGSALEGPNDFHPQQLTVSAQEVAAKVIGFAAVTERSPSLRDVWVALSMQEHGVIPRLLDHLGIERHELLRRVSGAWPPT